MKISYTCVGEYKGQNFKIISTRTCPSSDCEYIAVIEVDGVESQKVICSAENMFDNVNEGIQVAKQFIRKNLNMRDTI